MKQTYEQPSLELLLLGEYDVLTFSDDNDAPFLPPADSPDDGWSGYH